MCAKGPGEIRGLLQEIMAEYARQSLPSERMTRMPRMQGLPPLTPGVCVMRSRVPPRTNMGNILHFKMFFHKLDEGAFSS